MASLALIIAMTVAVKLNLLSSLPTVNTSTKAPNPKPNPNNNTANNQFGNG